mgnify:CR=1 FL=1
MKLWVKIDERFPYAGTRRLRRIVSLGDERRFGLVNSELKACSLHFFINIIDRTTSQSGEFLTCFMSLPNP